MKWAFLSESEDHLAIRLSEYLTSKACSNELNRQKVDLASIQTPEHYLSLGVDQIRMTLEVGSALIPQIHSLPYQERVNQSFDAYFYDRGVWWIRSFLYTAVCQLVSDRAWLAGEGRGPQALAVGMGPASRLAISALFRGGFRHFLIATGDEVGAIRFASELKRLFLGGTFEPVLPSKLILLSGDCQVVVNTLEFATNESLLRELLYFNFISPDGAVWDFTTSGQDQPFLTQAREFGLAVADGVDIQARADLLWAQHVFKKKFEYSDYVSFLKQSGREGDTKPA